MSVVSAKAGIRRAALKAQELVSDETKTVAERQKALDDVDTEIKGFRAELDLHDKLNAIHGLADLPGEEDGDEKAATVATKRPHTIAGMVTASDAYKTARQASGANQHFVKSLELQGVSVKSAATLDEGVAPAQAGSSGITGAPITPELLPGIVPKLFQPLYIESLLASGTIGSNSLSYVVESSFNDNTAVTPEKGRKPQVDLGLARVNDPVVKIANLAKVTDEMFEDFDAIQSYLQGRMVFGIQRATESELLNGDGTGSHMTGLLHRSGLTVTPAVTSAKATDIADGVFAGVTKIRSVAFGEPDAIVMNPTDWQVIRLGKDSNGQYFAGGPFTGAYGNAGPANVYNLWGFPVIVTTAVAAGTALVGAFQQGAQVFTRSGITVEMTNSNEDDFANDLISLRAEVRKGLAVYRPAWFTAISLGAASSVGK